MTSSVEHIDLAVVGGGAAGFYAAVSAAHHSSVPVSVAIFEQGRRSLAKVRVSGGGRCNLTHAEFDPRALAGHYPRGARELLGPFHRFGPGDTMAWFDERGVPTKIEDDGRVFPVSDSSESVAGCLEREAADCGVEVRYGHRLESLTACESGYRLAFANADSVRAGAVVMAAGSSPGACRILEAIGVRMVPQVPSLFTFNIHVAALHRLKGLSVPFAEIVLPSVDLVQSGALLVTHWGLSGPAVLKSSARAARELYDCRYDTEVVVRWLGEGPRAIRAALDGIRASAGARQVGSGSYLGFPKRLWAYVVERAGLGLALRWADLTRSQLTALSEVIGADTYRMRGKTRFKEEFVTAGGVALDELDWRRFELKRYPGLYVVGELLDVDGVTGGFNFQAAWTGGYLAGVAAANAAVG